jgi:hypothetical protein
MKKEERQKLREKFGGRCAYCGVVLGEIFHVDHVVPKYRGGKDTEENFYPSCARCNKRKDTFSIEEFRNQIQNQVSVLRRNVPLFRLCEDFFLIEEISKPVKFWFEKFNELNEVGE